MTRDVLERKENPARMDGWGLYQVVCIYDSVYCPVCDRKQPHVELMHWTGVNTSHPVDDHRRTTSLNCLGHCDTELIEESVIAQASFYDEGREHWFHTQLRHKPYGNIACEHLGQTSTDAYFYDYNTSQDKAGRRPLDLHWGGCGPATRMMANFPFDGTQEQKNYYCLQVMQAEFLKREKARVPKPGQQLELF